jgi:signal peptidase I
LGSTNESDTDRDEILDRARHFVDEVEAALDRTGDCPDDVRSRIVDLLNELRQTLEDGDPDAVEQTAEELEALAADHLDFARKSIWREYAESIGLAIVFALIVRAFIVEAFKIPTKSMVPTLLVGDHLFVSKSVYGVRIPFTDEYLIRFQEPERGEVVVFRFPTDSATEYLKTQPPSERDCIDATTLGSGKDFIKRVVGVEGDRIRVRNHQLYVNGRAARQGTVREQQTDDYLFPRKKRIVEKLGTHRYTIQYAESRGGDFGPITVKKDHVFVMGDHRDNSSDSRCWGQVPTDHLKGRAWFIWLSVGEDSFRWDRFFTLIH